MLSGINNKLMAMMLMLTMLMLLWWWCGWWWWKGAQLKLVPGRAAPQGKEGSLRDRWVSALPKILLIFTIITVISPSSKQCRWERPISNGRWRGRWKRFCSLWSISRFLQKLINDHFLPLKGLAKSWSDLSKSFQSQERIQTGRVSSIRRTGGLTRWEDGFAIYAHHHHHHH